MAEATAATTTIELPNTLAHVEGTAVLYFSLWMRGLEDATPYTDVWPRRAEPLVLGPDIHPDPVPVVADSASITYLRSRSVKYQFQMYLNENGDKRGRIRAVTVSLVPEGDDAITMDLGDFLERYLAQRYLPQEESDSDEEERLRVKHAAP